MALDYDPTAQKVAEVGFAFCKEMGAEVTLLHIIADPTYYASTVYDPIMGFGGYVNMDWLRQDIIDDLEKTSVDFLEKSKYHLGDKNIKILVKNGRIPESILEAAKELNTDIIILGSHSRRWLDNIVMGSITEKVLRHTPIPLFIIPTKKLH